MGSGRGDVRREHVLAQEIYLQGGTQGVGIGAAVSFNSMLGAHADFNAIDLSHDFTVAGNRYQDDLKLRSGLRGHLSMARQRLPATLGLRFNDDELRGVSVPTNGSYVFGGKRYPAMPGMNAVAEARYPTVMPYFGIGYGHRPASKGLGFVAILAWRTGYRNVHAVAGTGGAAGPAKRFRERAGFAAAGDVALSVVPGVADRDFVSVLSGGQVTA